MSIKGEPCIFNCGNDSTRAGEHVIPKWLNTWMHNAWGGPYPVSRNGKPFRDRDGKIWQGQTPIAHKAPCCEEHNTILAKRFETRKPDVEAFLESRPYDRDSVGLWWLKTLLLFTHPGTRDTVSPRVSLIEDLISNPDVYSWMVDNIDPPDWLYVFCSVPLGADQNKPEWAKDQPVWLPSWNDQTGRCWTPAVRHLGIANVEFQLVYAPGFEFSHPAPKAHQLWPPSNGTFVNEGKLTTSEFETWNNAFSTTGSLIMKVDSDLPGPLEVPFKATSLGMALAYSDARVRGLQG